MFGVKIEFTYATCGSCGQPIQTLDVNWYHESNGSMFCTRENDDMAFPIKSTITTKKPLPPVEYAVKICCIHCGLPIHKWDNGKWYHIRMGQIECSIKNPDGFKATPPEKD